MSRTPWWSLTALLAVVAGLLCGPAAFGGAGEGGVRAASAVRVLAQDAGRAAGAASTPGAAAARTPMGPAPAFAVGGASAPASPPGAVEAGAPASAPGAADIGVPAEAEAEAEAEDAPVPGCGKLRDHDGEPAVPSRARGGHDQAPGLAPWGLPAATGAPSAEPPPGVRARAPAPYTPTPVELSVLRV